MSFTSIVIPVYNQLFFTKLCLESLKANTPPDTYEVVVVDNGSTDGTAEYLKAQGSSWHILKVISNGQNLGCAPAWNQGVRESKGDYICIANNDLIFPPNWLPNLIDGMEGKDFWAAEPFCREGELDYSLAEFASTSMRRNEGKTDSSIIGCCMMFRNEVFQKVGFFDERFAFGKGEDKDFLKRMSLQGLEWGRVGGSFVHHFGSVTIKQIKSEQPGFEEKNLEAYRQKWGENPEFKPSFWDRIKRSFRKWKQKRGYF